MTSFSVRTLFDLRGELPAAWRWILVLIGVAIVLSIWHILTAGGTPIVNPAVLPSPWRLGIAFSDLYYENALIRNTFRSLGINLAGYVEAILIALPLGFLIGLLPLFRAGFQRQVEALRYVPLTAVTGLFVVWFGVGMSMKVHFLAFGILIYLLPVVIQRIDEVEDVYLKMVYTLGSTSWQTIKTVYWPSVSSRIIDDIRVLTAISWTYIIVAENYDASQGGLGSLIWRVGQRQGRMDKVFALLLLIILIGIFQDKIFKWMDKALFPFKYQNDKAIRKSKLKKHTLFKVISSFFINTLIWILIGTYWLIALNEWWFGFGALQPFQELFAETAWAVHLIMAGVTFFKLWKLRSGMASDLLTADVKMNNPK